MRPAYLLMALAPSLSSAPAQDWKPPEYTAHRAGSPILIDGSLDEPAWFGAPSARLEFFPWWKEGKKERTVVKVLWDDTYLYVAHASEDAHITARHTERDGKIPDDDCFEIMLSPDPTKPEVYFNLEWNVLGGLLDNFRPHGPKQPRTPKWDAEGVQIRGKYAGTLNNDADADRYWTVEAAIPFRNFSAYMPATPPRPGAHWNVNFNRHGGETNGQYSQWSPADTAQPNFHTPHRFGRLIFSGGASPFDAHSR
jgi:hypothetical protein